MNSFNEKEKKLNTALNNLKNLDLSNPDMKNDIESQTGLIQGKKL